MAQLIMRKYLYILVLIAMVFLGGCWYSFTDKPYPQIESIGVIPLENQTPEYDVASIATDYLTQKLSSGSAYNLSSPDGADGVVSGKIISYTRKVNTYDESENPVDYIIKVKASLTFIQRIDNKKLWETTFESYATFPADGDELGAKNDAIKMLTERIYDKLKGG
ncbi:hypothetical protein J7L68_00215 [bacterium]|nr:hypothetical protein [bacterium]